MASALHRVGNLADISGTLAWRSEKMKYGAVMPQIVGRGFQLNSGDVANEPMHALRDLPQSFPVRIDGGLRDVQDGDVFVAADEKIIDQCGFTSADIDDG
jgi:hypothetical protein